MAQITRAERTAGKNRMCPWVGNASYICRVAFTVFVLRFLFSDWLPEAVSPSDKQDNVSKPAGNLSIGDRETCTSCLQDAGAVCKNKPSFLGCYNEEFDYTL